MTNLSVFKYQEALVVDSRLIAARLGIEHRALMQTLKKRQDKLELRFGVITFQMSKPEEGSVGGRPEKYALLTEPQATALMTFSRNTEEVVDCKLDLVQAFERAKETIKTVVPEQSERIRELELQVAIAQAHAEAVKNERLLFERRATIYEFNGEAGLLTIDGKKPVVIDQPTIEVIDDKHKAYFKGQTLKQVAEYVKKRYGIRIKDGGVVKKALKAADKDTLIAHIPRTVVGEYVPQEHLNEVYKILTEGSRQMLIGE
ncbi:MAG TPA: Rha family transcriptional regulator [Cyanophyceae cyanobacterium]